MNALSFLIKILILFGIVSSEELQTDLILSSSATDSENLELVWEDDFNSDSLNDTYWTAVDDGVTYNEELQYYSKSNVTQTDGSLFLTAENEKYDDTHPYTSGKITTKGKVSFQYGRIEIRAKYPNEVGMFPAIWMQPVKNESPEGVAPLPEIDILENVGNAPDTVYTVLHYLDENGEFKKSVGTHYITDPNEFHTYAIEWTSDSLEWYIDNVLVHSTNENVPTVPMYLNINLAVGGSWFPPPDKTTKFPAQFEIDYVRYYSNGGI